MEELWGTGFGVFIGLTLGVAGSASWLLGQALGGTWRPAWQVVVYTAMLGCANRFLSYGLFDGHLLSLGGYLIDTAVLMVISLFAFQVTRARKMVSQYPWIYEPAGLFGWRRKGGADDA